MHEKTFARDKEKLKWKKKLKDKLIKKNYRPMVRVG